ncbi:hypothetical protein TNIN_128601 [Trichonephila inaurata madagascariensis]|uniref:Uncharacterized protein n=1 Tax=Trichonephila inaurata madagascariensis TaxID=2747483 RepID=A0A8X6X6I4_9ARAC|nr:hypothetical protein TNIN_128601 [Trichonephila inaurata madagascariensis]
MSSESLSSVSEDSFELNESDSMTDALLKRLESTKASRNLSRSVLLRDYDRRTPGVLSRASSRSSYPNSCQSSLRNSNMTSGRSSSISVKSSNSSSHTSLLRSHSASTST